MAKHTNRRPTHERVERCQKCMMAASESDPLIQATFSTGARSKTTRRLCPADFAEEYARLTRRDLQSTEVERLVDEAYASMSRGDDEPF